MYVDWLPDCDPVLSGKKNNRGGRRGTQSSYPIILPPRTLRLNSLIGYGMPRAPVVSA